MSEQNKAVIRRFFEEAINKGNLDAMDEVYAHDAEVRLPGVPGDPYGPSGVKRLVAGILTAFPGVQVTIDALVAENDMVASFISFFGPFQGGSIGPSPYLPMVAWARMDLFHMFEGRIVEHWADRDDSSVLHQLGINL